MSLSYRPEIDGLRAIAVLAVVAYHAGLGGAGFVGVDIFFVISGYLITALLLREVDTTARIDFLAFYARRVRRIFPAATLVVLVTLGLSWLLLGPADLSQVANSAAAAALFAANLFFQFTTGGYWDASAEQMPLLHLWSLSVEEQFYLVWPALLVLVLREWPNRLVPVLAALAIVSLAAAEWFVRTDPQAVFYQTPLRFWELAAGGLIAALPARKLPRPAAWLGLGVIVAACIWPAGRFPGVGALPAVVGTALVIAAVHGGASNALLRSRPFILVGLISYSLYLWHWPLLALYRVTSIGEGSLAVRLQLCGVAVLLAAATYRYVEQPFRRATWPKGRLVAGGFATMAAVAAGALAMGVQAQSRIPTVDPLVTQAMADRMPRNCHATAMDTAAAKCPTPGAKVAIWGDSMGWSWLPAAQALGPKVAQFTRDGCGPFLGFLPANAQRADTVCREANAAIPAAVKGFDAVVLVALWSNDAPRLQAFERTLAAVAPNVGRVYVIGPSPRLRDDATRCFERHDADACAVPRAEFEALAAPVLDALRLAASSYPNVVVVDPATRLCTDSACPAVLDGVPLYWDSHHVTATAARRLVLPRG